MRIATSPLREPGCLSAPLWTVVMAFSLRRLLFLVRVASPLRQREGNASDNAKLPCATSPRWQPHRGIHALAALGGGSARTTRREWTDGTCRTDITRHWLCQRSRGTSAGGEARTGTAHTPTRSSERWRPPPAVLAVAPSRAVAAQWVAMPTLIWRIRVRPIVLPRLADGRAPVPWHPRR